MIASVFTLITESRFICPKEVAVPCEKVGLVVVSRMLSESLVDRHNVPWRG